MTSGKRVKNFYVREESLSSKLFEMLYMGCDARKPVFGVSDKVTFKPACSASKTSYGTEISHVASLDMTLSN